MQPDAQLAMQGALAFGPGHCPTDLFDGSVAAIIRGLKVHANTIAHARHVAIEETYPKLRDAIGAEALHQAAERHLTQPHVLGRPLDRVGEGLAEQIEDARARDLARIEWAWLVAYHAAEAPALSLEAIAGLTPEQLVQLEVSRHPAAAIVIHETDEGATLVTRPEAEVVVSGPTREAAALFERFDAPRPLGTVLSETEPVAVLALIAVGALTFLGDLP